jgi:hypothetical protein
MELAVDRLQLGETSFECIANDNLWHLQRCIIGSASLRRITNSILGGDSSLTWSLSNKVNLIKIKFVYNEEKSIQQIH